MTLSLSLSSTKTPHPDTSHRIRRLQLVLFTKTKTSATQMRIHILLSLLWRILESYHTIKIKRRVTEHVLEDTFILYYFQTMIIWVASTGSYFCPCLHSPETFSVIYTKSHSDLFYHTLNFVSRNKHTLIHTLNTLECFFHCELRVNTPSTWRET